MTLVTRGMLLAAALLFCATFIEANARECTSPEKRLVLQPAVPGDTAVRLRCSLTLDEGEIVTRQIRIIGAEASGLTLRCRGGVIGSPGRRSLNYRKDMIRIRSARLSENKWSRPENVVIDGCTVNGAIRIMGLGPNGQAKGVARSSRRSNHTRFAQASAPTGIILRNLTITGDGRVPVYFAPGVTHSRLVDSTVRGTSISSGIYLDAESAYNTIAGNIFDVSSPREILSIDGSAHNIVVDKLFHTSNLGGIYIYRNCGEGGSARHQKPRFNEIRNNRFLYTATQATRPTIWLSYKSIGRTLFLCPQDRDIGFGSGIDNSNFADSNTVAGNMFVNSPTVNVIRNGGAKNRIFDNRRLAN